MQTTTTATTVYTKPEFGQLYKENFSTIVDYLNKKVFNDRQQAEDLALRVFDKAEAAYDRFIPNKNPKSWLLIIARNVFLDHCRRNKVTVGMGTVNANNMGGVFDNKNYLDYGVLYGAIETLSEQQKQVINLRFFEGLGYEEIAKEAQIPVGTVKNRIHLAKKKLSELLVGIL